MQAQNYHWNKPTQKYFLVLRLEKQQDSDMTTHRTFTRTPGSARSLLPLPHEQQHAGYKRKVIPHRLLGQHRSHTGWSRTHNGSHSSTIHWNFYEDSSVSVRICQKWDVTFLESNDVHKSMFRKMCLQWHMQNLHVRGKARVCTSTSV